MGTYLDKVFGIKIRFFGEEHGDFSVKLLGYSVKGMDSDGGKTQDTHRAYNPVAHFYKVQIYKEIYFINSFYMYCSLKT